MNRLIVVATVLLCGAVESTRAAVHYTITALPSPYGTTSTALGINNAG